MPGIKADEVGKMSTRSVVCKHPLLFSWEGYSEFFPAIINGIHTINNAGILIISPHPQSGLNFKNPAVLTKEG